MDAVSLLTVSGLAIVAGTYGLLKLLSILPEELDPFGDD